MAINPEPVNQPESDLSDEYDSDSDSTLSKSPFLKTPSPPQPQASSSEEEEEEEDESDSDSEVHDPSSISSSKRPAEEKELDKGKDSKNSDSSKRVRIWSEEDEIATWLAPTRGSNGLTVDERVLRIGAKLFEGVNRVEGYKEWKNLLIKELEIREKMLNLMRARAELVLDYLKSKNQS